MPAGVFIKLDKAEPGTPIADAGVWLTGSARRVSDCGVDASMPAADGMRKTGEACVGWGEKAEADGSTIPCAFSAGGPAKLEDSPYWPYWVCFPRAPGCRGAIEFWADARGWGRTSRLAPRATADARGPVAALYAWFCAAKMGGTYEPSEEPCFRRVWGSTPDLEGSIIQCGTYLVGFSLVVCIRNYRRQVSTGKEDFSHMKLYPWGYLISGALAEHETQTGTRNMKEVGGSWRL